MREIEQRIQRVKGLKDLFDDEVLLYQLAFGRDDIEQCKLHMAAMQALVEEVKLEVKNQ